VITDAMHQLRSKFASKLGILTHLTPLTTKESLNSGEKPVKKMRFARPVLKK
jgi:hypothetical protein